MKRVISIISLCFTLISLNSCDTLDIENIYSYDAEKVWNDENLANAYLANLYAIIFDNWNVAVDAKTQQLSNIYLYEDRVTISNSEFKEWDYSTIRLINEAIQNTQKGGLSEEIKNNIIGQALFLRAYVYFKMVMYHGGVPYITIPQDKDKDDLYVKRNSTKECFDFIIQDLDDAIKLLPEKISSTSSDYGKVDGCFALAFKAKVLLFKSSPQYNPTDPWNNSYWKEAYNVNKAAYDKLKKLGYALTEDYNDIFLVERGPEVIFSVINTYPNKVAVWDDGARPGSEGRNPADYCPTWELVKAFPMKDGKLYSDPTSKYYMSDDEFLQNYWKNRDPRFNKSIVWNGGIYEVGGKTGNRQYMALGVANGLDDFGINPKAGVNSTNLNRYTGFFIKKGCKLSLKQSEVLQYDVDFIVMRFAEVLLNYAEAANEVGEQTVALNLLKEIRERAGIEAGDNGLYGIDASSRETIREAILAERNIEFCFEDQYFWAVRRLRMLDRLDKQTKHGVEAIPINPDGSEMSIAEAIVKANNNELTEEDFKYVVHQIPFAGAQVTSVPDKYYFFPINATTISANPNIEQNIDWGGTFDPTLK